jgi:hypothetical protein
MALLRHIHCMVPLLGIADMGGGGGVIRATIFNYIYINVTKI